MSPTNEKLWSVCLYEGILQDSTQSLLRPIRVADTVDKLTPDCGFIIPLVLDWDWLVILAVLDWNWLSIPGVIDWD